MADENNVLIMTFPDPSKAFQALSEIKGQPGVTEAAVVERTALAAAQDAARTAAKEARRVRRAVDVTQHHASSGGTTRYDGGAWR